MSETWVINETPTLTNLTANINFTTNNYSCGTIAILFNTGTFGKKEIDYYTATGGIIEAVYMSGTGWDNENYRTVIFPEPLDLSTPIGQWFSTNAEKQAPSKITLDLSTLNLPEGTHSIQMSLSGSGKRDSELSEAVEYTVEPQGYTVSGTVTYAYNGNNDLAKYSLDNGLTWNDIGSRNSDNEQFILANVTQIKFKTPNVIGQAHITSTTLGLSLYGRNSASENFILNSDIDDLSISADDGGGN